MAFIKQLLPVFCFAVTPHVYSLEQFVPGIMRPMIFPFSGMGYVNPWANPSFKPPAPAIVENVDSITHLAAQPAPATHSKEVVEETTAPPSAAITPSTSTIDAPNPLMAAKSESLSVVGDDLVAPVSEDLSKRYRALLTADNHTVDKREEFGQKLMAGQHHGDVLLSGASAQDAGVVATPSSERGESGMDFRNRRLRWYQDLVLSQRRVILSHDTYTEQGCKTAKLWSYTTGPNSTKVASSDYNECVEVGNTGRFLSATIDGCGFSDDSGMSTGYWDYCLELGVDKSQGVQIVNNYCEFKDVLQTPTRTATGSWSFVPSVVMYFEEGCNHSSPLDEVFTQVYNSTGDVMFAKVDITTNPRLAQLAGVDSTPTIKFYGGGLNFTESFEYDSEPSKDKLRSWVQKLLKGGIDEFHPEMKEIAPRSVWKKTTSKYRCYTDVLVRGNQNETVDEWLEHAYSDCAPKVVPELPPIPAPVKWKPLPFSSLVTHNGNKYTEYLAPSEKVMDYSHNPVTTVESGVLPPENTKCNGSDNDSCAK